MKMLWSQSLIFIENNSLYSFYFVFCIKQKQLKNTYMELSNEFVEVRLSNRFSDDGDDTNGGNSSGGGGSKPPEGGDD